MVDIGAYDQSATLNITIDSSGARKGARQVNKSLDSISNTTKTASTNGMMLKRVLIGIGGAISFAVVTNYADKWKEAGNKLRLYTNSAEELRSMQLKLLDVANRTRASFDPVVTLYSRLAANSKMLGKSQADMLKFVELTNVAIALSGSAATEAASAVLQLSQAISSPQVFGQEIKAIILNAPRLAKAIAEGLGFEHGNTAMLKEMVSRGELSNIQLVNALLSQSNKLLEEYGTTKLSISKAFTILNNNMKAFIGLADEGVGASDLIAKAILAIGTNFDRIVKSISIAGVALVTGFLVIGTGVAKLTVLVGLLTGAFATLRLAIMLHPVGLLITGIAAATTALFLYRKEVGEFILGVDESSKKLKEFGGNIKLLEGRQEEFRKGMVLASGGVDKLKKSAQEGKKALEELDKSMENMAKEPIPPSDSRLGFFHRLLSIMERLSAPKERVADYSGAELAYGEALELPRRPSMFARDHSEWLELVEKEAQEMIEKNEKAVTDRLRAYQRTLPDNFVLSDEDIKSKGTEANLEYASSQEKLNKTLADLNQYRIAGTLQEENYRRAINATYAEVPLIIGSINSWNAHIQELSKTWEEDLTDTMVEWTMTGRDSWKEFAQSVIDSLYKMAVQAAIVTPIFNALKAAMNFATGYFGGGGGNENATQDASLDTGIGTGAVGGPMTAHKPYLVGERGMELFIPQQNGYLVPNNRLNKFSGGSSVGGGGNVMVNVYNNARGTEASANVNDDGNGNFDIDILVSQVEGRLESNINRGQGLAPTLQRRYRLNSARGSVL